MTWFKFLARSTNEEPRTSDSARAGFIKQGAGLGVANNTVRVVPPLLLIPVKLCQHLTLKVLAPGAILTRLVRNKRMVGKLSLENAVDHPHALLDGGSAESFLAGGLEFLVNVLVWDSTGQAKSTVATDFKQLVSLGVLLSHPGL